MGFAFNKQNKAEVTAGNLGDKVIKGNAASSWFSLLDCLLCGEARRYVLRTHRQLGRETQRVRK